MKWIRDTDSSFALMRRGEKGCVRWRLVTLLKLRWTSRGLMLPWRWCIWKTICDSVLGQFIIIATSYGCMLTGMWCWVPITIYRYRICATREGRGREVAVTWAPSSPTWVRPHRLKGSRVTRNDNQWKHQHWVNGKTDVQIHLEVIFNWNDFTVPNTIGDINRDLQLARDAVFWVWWDSVPNYFAYALFRLISGATGTIHCFLHHAVFGCHFFGRGVADFGNNR